jgi:hypothetical protein
MQRMKELRIVPVGISGGRSLTRLLRDARRFPSTRWYPVPGATRTPLGLGFVHHSRAIVCLAVPNLSVTIRNFCNAVLNNWGQFYPTKPTERASSL